MKKLCSLDFNLFHHKSQCLQVQFKEHIFLPAANTRQRHTHIYYYGKATSEEPMATVQPPQFQLACYPSYFVLQELSFILIHWVLNSSPMIPLYSGGNALPLFSLVSRFRFPFSSTSWRRAPCSTHLALMCRISEVQKFNSCLESNQWNHKVIQDNIFGLSKSTTREKKF